MLTAVAHGTLLAFGLILPLGPQNAFVISQGARQPGRARALPVVVAAALCDTLLILLAVLGVSLVVLGVPAVRGARSSPPAWSSLPWRSSGRAASPTWAA